MKSSAEPDFTEEEAYLIAYYRNPATAPREKLSILESIPTIFAILLAIYAFVVSIPALALVALVMFLFVEFQKKRNSTKYAGAFRSIILKYEESLGKYREFGEGD